MEATAPTLTDDQITALIDDPAKIETHEQALTVLDCLDAEIANIQAQVDAAVIEANARPLASERQAWLRRATYAGAMRRNERHRVMQRDKELRGTKRPGIMPGSKTKEEKLAKQQRLLAEAEARKAAKQAEIERQKTQQMDLAQRRRELDFATLRAALTECAQPMLADLESDHDGLLKEFDRRVTVAQRALGCKA